MAAIQNNTRSKIIREKLTKTNRKTNIKKIPITVNNNEQENKNKKRKIPIINNNDQPKTKKNTTQPHHTNIGANHSVPNK